MKFWDNPAAKAMVLWTTAVAACVLVALFTMCCASKPLPMTPGQAAKAAQIALCEKTVREQIASHDHCPEAQLAINSSAECAAIYPNGIDIDCPEYRK